MKSSIRYFDWSDIAASFRWIWRDEKERFERDFAHYIGKKYAVGTSYGRTALYAGLKAIDVNDKEVIIPAFICTVVRHAVITAGATPRFVDINSKNFDFDLDDLKKKITPKTRAIVLTHMFGRVARNITEVIKIARENNIILIEDCAHSLGATYKGKKIGSFGDFSIFSLTKNMINFGGGVLVTDNDNMHLRVRDLLRTEKNSIRKRVVDFPFVLAYGLEQILDKLMLNRVRKPKLWLLKLPDFFLTIRRLFLKLVKLPQIILTFIVHHNRQSLTGEKKIEEGGYEQDINMESIIASCGRNQLRKIDSLIDNRKKIYEELFGISFLHEDDLGSVDFRDAYTHIVLRFKNKDIWKVAYEASKTGPFLKATWPTHQKLWEFQNTENVLRIKKEILTYIINPDLTKQEIVRFNQMVNAIDAKEQFSLNNRSQEKYTVSYID